MEYKYLNSSMKFELKKGCPELTPEQKYWFGVNSHWHYEFKPYEKCLALINQAKLYKMNVNYFLNGEGKSIREGDADTGEVGDAVTLLSPAR